MHKGRLEVICGPMFAGKTEELIRRVKRAAIAKQRIIVYKPAIDTRFGEGSIVSHASTSLEAATGVKPVVIDKKLPLELKDWKKYDVYAFDEIQFFHGDVLTNIITLHEMGKRVICAGLDLDSHGVPFSQGTSIPRKSQIQLLPELLARADEVVKVKAVCVVCREDANRTYRIIDTSEQVAVGGAESYEPRCLNCWHLGPSATKEPESQ